MPKSLSLDLIEPGIVLAEPVTNSLGQTLINSGITLTAKHISILRTWNIHIVSVIDDDNEEVSELSESQIEYARTEIKKLLTWSPRNEAEEDLIELGVLAIAHLYKQKDTKDE
jgi:hypothetical protein